MKLYLVQHAQAKTEDEDPKRPLSDKGMSDIRKIADFIEEHRSIHLNTIWHSGKTRAKQTAEVLADCLYPTDGVKETAGLKPQDNPKIWLSRLSKTNEDSMLVGHLPHLAKLAALLLCNDDKLTPVAFFGGGIVCLERDEKGNWSVVWMITPGILT